MWTVAVCVLALALSWTIFMPLGTNSFLPGACERADQYLRQHIVGQDLAIDQLMAALCTHIETPEPQKPLIISVHGPPGVGKTYTHLLLARALYNKDPNRVDCPGAGCAGYKVVYGLDFHETDRMNQLTAVRDSIMTHVQGVKDPLLVFEEYDKLDCTARTWLRHLLSHASEMGPMKRAVILLESNLGYTQLEEMLSDVNGDVSKLTFEGAEKTLRDTLFAYWRTPRHTHAATATSATAAVGETAASQDSHQQQHQHQPLLQQPFPACEESYVDTMRFTALVDFFLPYLPLQRHHIIALVLKSLERERVRLQATKNVNLEWDDGQVAWLTDKVEFDGPYPLEGAKQVASVMTRYVAPALRRCPDASKAKLKAPALVLKFS